MCSMETLRRKTVNFDRRDSQAVAPFLDADTTEHAALEALVGHPLSSDSAELRALVLLGIRHVQEALLEDAYNDAVDAGDFAETADWIRGTRARRRSHD